MTLNEEARQRGITAANTAMALRPSAPPAGYVPLPRRLQDNVEIEPPADWDEQVADARRRTEEAIERIELHAKSCMICYRPMAAGQQFHHALCGQLRDAGQLPEATPDKHWLTSEYKDYLKSAQWRKFRGNAIKAAGGKCERCDERSGLHVHHKHYRTLGNEQPGDVLVLCGPHHDDEHKRISAHNLADARFEGWARKVHGEDWLETWWDKDELYRQYDNWRERKAADW